MFTSNGPRPAFWITFSIAMSKAIGQPASASRIGWRPSISTTRCRRITRRPTSRYSEVLRLSAPTLPVLIASRQPFGIGPHEISEQERQVPRPTPHPAIAAIPVRTGRDIARQTLQARPKGTGHVHIFHQGNVPKSAHSVILGA